MRRFWLLPVLMCGACNVTPQPETTDLHDAWEFRRVGGAEWLPASVPGVVHLDLLANGLIGDPFYRDNEYRQQWIEHEDWEYRTAFSVSQRHLEHRNHELVFEGLDTYAAVSLNGVVVLESDNMFREYEVDVSNALRAGENMLEVQFRSPIHVATPIVEALGYELPQGNDRAARPTGPACLPIATRWIRRAFRSPSSRRRNSTSDITSCTRRTAGGGL